MNCRYCGKEIDLSLARRRCGRKYEKGAYDDEFPDDDVCEDCADEIIGDYMVAGADALELAERCGFEWD